MTTSVDPFAAQSVLPWAAPVAEGPVDADVAVPGSKSLTNRLLVLAAIAGSPTTLRRPLHARDTMLMAQALRALGIDGDDVDDPDPAVTTRGWVIEPRPMLGPATIDCGLAGTVMRFVPPLAALADGPVAFDGDPQARTRPMGPILRALRDLGVTVQTQIAGEDRLPFAILGRGRVPGGRVVIDASASSQFVSALLLVGCRFDEGLEVAPTGPVPSLPHIRMTLDLLRRAGLDAEQTSAGTWTVAPGVPQLDAVTVEPDLSNAMPFVAAALLTGGRVRIDGWPSPSLQPDAEVRDLIRQLGGTIEDPSGAGGLTVRGAGAIPGGTYAMDPIGELVPTLAALAVHADGPVTITGVAHLRGHETDRLAALVTEINRIGGDADETADGLIVRPRALIGGAWRTYADHRMATAGAIIGLRARGVVVDDITTTSKTLPGFDALWTRMLGGAPA